MSRQQLLTEIEGLERKLSVLYNQMRGNKTKEGLSRLEQEYNNLEYRITTLTQLYRKM